MGLFSNNIRYAGGFIEQEDGPVMIAMLDGTGMTVYRLHDHMHAGRPDGIIAGELKKLQWDCDYDNEFAVHLHQKKTAREIAAELEWKWGLARVRMAGDLDTPMDGVYLMIGAFGEENHMKQLQKDDCQVLVVGETSEWRIGEYIRDAHQLGFHFLGDLVAAHDKHPAAPQELLRHIPARFALLGDRLTQKS